LEEAMDLSYYRLRDDDDDDDDDDCMDRQRSINSSGTIEK
jgi:hypothetical protein